jgi:hypothetical protein
MRGLLATAGVVLVAVTFAGTASALPNTTIHGPYGVGASRASFHLIATGGAVRVQCKRDRGRWYVCLGRASGQITLRRLSRGRHTLYARGVNAAGRVDPTPARRSFRI